jgi:hypothetical protein
MNIGLITEGASEHRIMKHILSKFFKEADPLINQVQPKILNDKQETLGGWVEVLKYCERQQINDILIENDYLVVQIDTDQSQQSPFSVSHTAPNNEPKTVETLCADVRERLIRAIKPAIWNQHKDKIFFAICVHEIECWLLPLCSNNHKSATSNCIDKLNTMLRRNNEKTIPQNDKNSTLGIRAYEAILKNWRKKSEITASSCHNPSFKVFIDALNI